MLIPLCIVFGYVSVPERTDLLRYATNYSRGTQMRARNKKKKKKKLDLLEMSNLQRIQLIREVKTKLRQKIMEEKLWQQLLEAENLTINGNAVYRENQQLSGFYLRP
jgi:hypothetical protein